MTERGVWRPIATDEWVDVTLVIDACQVVRPVVRPVDVKTGRCVSPRASTSCACAAMSLFAMPVSACCGRHPIDCVAAIVAHPFVVRCAASEVS